MHISDGTLEKLLSQSNTFTKEDIAALKDESARTHKPLQQVAIDKKLVDDNSLTKLFADYAKIPYIELGNIPWETLQRIPERIARQYNAVLFKVDETGTVSLPLVGPVGVRGLTVNEAAGKIAAALTKGFIRNPSVTAQIESYRPFFIQGAVKNGGQFPYVPGMTVRAAVSTAGGYSETANRNRVTVYRQQGNQMYKAGVDLDFPIYPGDTIVVAERWF